MLVSGGIPRGRSPKPGPEEQRGESQGRGVWDEGRWPGGKSPGLGSRPSLQLLYLEPYLEGMQNH